MNGDTPPEGVAKACPVVPPKHSTLVGVVATVNDPGPVSVTDSVAVHELLSVTVTVYVPAVKLLAVPLVEPVLQTNVYGEVPPVGLATAEPLVALAQPTFVPVMVGTMAAGSVRVTVAVAVQVAASVAVTV